MSIGEIGVVVWGWGRRAIPPPPPPPTHTAENYRDSPIYPPKYSLADYKQAAEPKPNKRMRSDVKQPTPVTTTDYKPYENVLPTTKTINDHKHQLVIQHEKEASTALFNVQEGTKVTVHYDTTQRSRIDGEWPSLILIFSDKRRFSIRPLFFAYEDKVQIVRLFI